jgi:arylsulfatase A-like enzyme
MRIVSLTVLGLLAGLLGMPASRAAEPARKRPNILFIFTDDQRADTIHALGNKFIRTPNLDRLVQKGTTFRRAYCLGGNSGAVCIPSRAMVLSGRPYFKITNDLKHVTTWPEMFARSGYVTFITGKWHNGEESLLRSFQIGKAVFLGGMGDPYNLPVADISPNHKLVNKRKSGKHSVELFTDQLVEFIRQHKGSKQPFLAYIAFNAPHDPRVAPKSYNDYYKAHPPPLPANFLPLHQLNIGNDLAGRDERLAPWPRTPEVVRKHLADYYAYIEFLDAQVGRILAALREAGLDEDTIIVFSSDHGLTIGSHGLFGKQNLYECAMHVPMMFAGPGVPRGKQSDALCYLFDIYPTLGELAKVKGPKGSTGMSLVPVMTGKETKVRDSLFFAFRDVQRAIRDSRWHLIVNTQINKMQLFDLVHDPDEIHDLAGEPTAKPTIKRLLVQLRQWQEEVGDHQALTAAHPQPLEFDYAKAQREQKKREQKNKK